ncbi:MAG: class I SAM-dependent methyltransferase [Pirellulales bacterium]
MPKQQSWRKRLMARLHRSVYASRIRGLVECLTPVLKPGDQVLDVGCGIGALGRAIMDAPSSPQKVTVSGLERVRRGNELIPVAEYDGRNIPHADKSFDVVILADVLHHETDPNHLLAECVRISRRLVVIKDHKPDGLFGHARICLLDWAANDPYAVPCLYRYQALPQWRNAFAEHRLTIDREWTRLRLYPFPYWLIFTDRLQYMAVLSRDENHISRQE